MTCNQRLAEGSFSRLSIPLLTITADGNVGFSIRARYSEAINRDSMLKTKTDSRERGFTRTSSVRAELVRFVDERRVITGVAAGTGRGKIRNKRGRYGELRYRVRPRQANRALPVLFHHHHRHRHRHHRHRHHHYHVAAVAIVAPTLYYVSAR